MMRTLIVPALLVASLGTATDALAESWGTVKGQVIWAGGDIPAPDKINVDANQDHCLAKGALYYEKWVIDKDTKGVANVVVWLAPIPPAKTMPIHPKLQDVPKDPLVIDQPQCAFVPHVSTMREGQTLIIKNSSPVPHNTNYSGSQLINPGGNPIIPPGKQIEVTDLKADRRPLTLACNIHKWMSGRVGVFNHPYHLVTKKDGTFEIKDAPAGSFRVFVWHEEKGWLQAGGDSKGQEITIPADGVLDLGKIEIKP